jgi:hypothetical protein
MIAPSWLVTTDFNVARFHCCFVMFSFSTIFHSSSAFSVDDDDPSVVLSTKSGPFVENGFAYDNALLVLKPGHQTLVIPDTARLVRTEMGKSIEVYMEKELDFGGHVKNLITIRDTRKRMGCATKLTDGKTILATYGEFSGLESCKSMNLVIHLPKDQIIELRKNLAGPINLRRPPESTSPPERERIKPGEGGWEAISDKPDSDRTASKKRRE